MTLVSADPVATTMTLDWTIIGESQSDCSSTNLAACSDVNIFFDKSDSTLSIRNVLTDSYFIAISWVIRIQRCFPLAAGLRFQSFDSMRLLLLCETSWLIQQHSVRISTYSPLISLTLLFYIILSISKEKSCSVVCCHLNLYSDTRRKYASLHRTQDWILWSEWG